jgi:hypothetical protein
VELPTTDGMDPLYGIAEAIYNFMESLIALAGPAASLLGFVVTVWALSAAPSFGLLHDLLWGATAVGAFGVLNLVPFKLHGKPGEAPLRSDGRLALDAARVVRALS